MPHSVIPRFAAVVMLGVLGSGFALPAVDELLYHRLPVSARGAVAHVDQAGGCDSHAEHCIAGPMVFAPRLAASPKPEVVSYTAVVDLAVATLASDPRNPPLRTPQQPRAPPIDLK